MVSEKSPEKLLKKWDLKVEISGSKRHNFHNSLYAETFGEDLIIDSDAYNAVFIFTNDVTKKKAHFFNNL